jgi:anaerobic magnesium-protoporphyrin IX monomethyl ester cyclase
VKIWLGVFRWNYRGKKPLSFVNKGSGEVFIFSIFERMSKAVLFNPFSTKHNPRVPNSLLAVAASIHGIFDYTLVDGNMEADPWTTIEKYFRDGSYKYFALTVMPGPALKQAIPFSKKIKALFPEVKIIWGGYFASNQYNVSITSGYVDYIIYGPGDKAFPQLLRGLEDKTDLTSVPNLIYRNADGEQVKTAKDPLYDQDTLPELPYDRLHTTYNLERYLPRTFLGKRTFAYHSSIGCPFVCSFCAVVPIYQARWKGKSAENIFRDVKRIKAQFNIDALEFHDNNFFVSERRTVAFAKLIRNENITWWGEARIDTMDKYSDESLRLIRESGCRMIFFGAETGNDEVLKQMDKGGTQSGEQILRFAERLGKIGIIPEYSFVLGTPASTEEEVNRRIDGDIAFIKQVKKVNPATEIIIYTYSPVPVEGSAMYNEVLGSGFRFPQTLEEWISPAWERFDLRKNPLTPWLKPYMIDKIRNFETVLNGYYPTVSDMRFTGWQKTIIKNISAPRYSSSLYHYPYEIKILQKLWKYRQPEKEGF